MVCSALFRSRPAGDVHVTALERMFTVLNVFFITFSQRLLTATVGSGQF